MTDLIPGATYNFRIAAYNSLLAENTFFDDNLNFSPSVSILAAILPSIISNFEQPTSGYISGQVLLQWSAPASNGSPITGY